MCQSADVITTDVTGTSISFSRSQQLRGIAIIAVVIIHIIGAIPSGYTRPDTQLTTIILDQLSRLCVPIFVMLSGYGLALKYQKKPLKWQTMLLERASKLLPAYLLWSIGSMVLFWAIPNWSYGGRPTGLVVQLLLGQADFQLYFVPMLMSLYAVFPLLWLLRKKPAVILTVTVLVQFLTISYFYLAHVTSDRYQYVFFLSWIGYFGFGIFLAHRALPQWVVRWLVPASLLSAIGACVDGWLSVRAGVDPLPALQFTRWPVMIYAFSVISTFAVVKLSPVIRGVLAPAQMVIGWIGRKSYVIFLAHTTAMRIIYAATHQQLPWPALTSIFVLWLGCVVVTNYLTERR